MGKGRGGNGTLINEEKLDQLLHGLVESDRLLNSQLMDLTKIIKNLTARVDELELVNAKLRSKVLPQAPESTEST